MREKLKTINLKFYHLENWIQYNILHIFFYKFFRKMNNKKIFFHSLWIWWIEMISWDYWKSHFPSNWFSQLHFSEAFLPDKCEGKSFTMQNFQPFKGMLSRKFMLWENTNSYGEWEFLIFFVCDYYWFQLWPHFPQTKWDYWNIL
jgi:hypothetical protein